LDWKQEAERLKFVENKTWREIFNQLADSVPNSSYEQARNKIRDYIRGCEQYKQQKEKVAQVNKAIGVIGDLHIPFDHPNYLQFLQDTFAQYNVGQIISCGDLIDNHAISRHQTETCAKSAYDELDASITRLKTYVKAFPKVKICQGNHDNILERQAATLGIGKRFLKSFNDLLELPNGWQIEEEFIIDNVLYRHGINCSGKDGALNAAIQERISLVMGHSHSFGGCKYSANKRDIIFGLNAGCGIDIDAYAFAYGKHAKYRPTLGCGIVFDRSNAIFVPMGEKYFRD